MAETKPRKLAIIASKGSLDMAYPPLILANAARMSGVEVDIFFTFWGLDIITLKKNEQTECGCGRQSQHAPLVPHPHPAGHHPRHVRRRIRHDAQRNRETRFSPGWRIRAIGL